MGEHDVADRLVPVTVRIAAISSLASAGVARASTTATASSPTMTPNSDRPPFVKGVRARGELGERGFLSARSACEAKVLALHDTPTITPRKRRARGRLRAARGRLEVALATVQEGSRKPVFPYARPAELAGRPRRVPVIVVGAGHRSHARDLSSASGRLGARARGRRLGRRRLARDLLVERTPRDLRSSRRRRADRRAGRRHLEPGKVFFRDPRDLFVRLARRRRPSLSGVS